MSRYRDAIFNLGRMPASELEPPKGALTPEEIDLARAKAAFSEKERIAKLAAPKELEELEILGETVPSPPVKRRYAPPTGLKLEIYKRDYGDFPDKDYYYKMDEKTFADLQTKLDRTKAKVAAELAKTDLEKFAAKQASTDKFRKSDKGLAVARRGNKKYYSKIKSQPDYVSYYELNKDAVDEQKATKYFEDNLKLMDEKVPNWRQLHQEKFPFLSEKAFLGVLKKNMSFGTELNPKSYLRRPFTQRPLPLKSDKFKNWIKQFKGFGGDKILKLTDEKPKIPDSFNPMKRWSKLLPWVNPALLAARGEYGEAAFEGGLNLMKFNPATLLVNEMFNAEKLGPPKGSEDYLIEHPWERPKTKGVLDLKNELM